MTEPILIKVVGLPQPQGNKSAFVAGGRAIMREGGSHAANERFKNWRAAVDGAVRRWLEEHPRPTITGPVTVDVLFTFPLPAGDQYRSRHVTRPDVEKCVRAIHDALVTGGLIRDDSQVWDVRARKRYCRDVPPGAVIFVTDNTTDEEADRAALKEAARRARGIQPPLPQA